jgi:predicted transcriptional regulator
MGTNRDNFTMRMRPEIRRRLQAIADRDLRSLAFVADQCFEGYLPVLESTARNAAPEAPKRPRK